MSCWTLTTSRYSAFKARPNSKKLAGGATVVCKLEHENTPKNTQHTEGFLSIFLATQQYKTQITKHSDLVTISKSSVTDAPTEYLCVKGVYSLL